MGTELVLKEAIRKGKKVFIASTSEVYGRGIQCPFNEEQDLLLGPTTKSRWSYAASKIVDEFLALAYYKKYNLPIVIGRFFNIVGERQVGRYGMVVPSFIKQAVNGNDIIVYGDGTQTRCFCYVKNAVQDILKLLDNEKCIGQVFNIGNDDEISITYLASEVKRLINSNSEIKYLPYDQAYEEGFEDMKRRVPDLNKIKKYIDWSERDSLPLIIEKCKIRMETGYA